MTQKIKHLHYCIIAILLFYFSSCAQSKHPPTIIGTWIIDSINVQAAEGIPADAIKKDDVIGQVYTFNRDSTFSVKLKDEKSDNKGSYSINRLDSQSYLTFINSAMGISTKMEITKLAEKEMKLKADFGNVFFEMHLKKQ